MLRWAVGCQFTRQQRGAAHVQPARGCTWGRVGRSGATMLCVPQGAPPGLARNRSMQLQHQHQKAAHGGRRAPCGDVPCGGGVRCTLPPSLTPPKRATVRTCGAIFGAARSQPGARCRAAGGRSLGCERSSLRVPQTSGAVAVWQERCSPGSGACVGKGIWGPAIQRLAGPCVAEICCGGSGRVGGQQQGIIGTAACAQHGR
jgi:hypothetical protein